MKNDYEIRGEITAIFLKRRNGEILETLISTSDLPKVKECPISWYANWHKDIKGFYVIGSLPKIDGKIQGKAFLHRLIFDNPEEKVIDHINHDTLNNTRTNLRVVTNQQNCQNKNGPQSNNTSGVRGVCWNNYANMWAARVTSNGKRISIGYFENLSDAEEAIKEARKKYMPFSKESQGA